MPLPRLARPFGEALFRLRGHFLYTRPVWTRSRSDGERAVRAPALEAGLRAGFEEVLSPGVLELPAGLAAGLGAVRPDLLGVESLLGELLEGVRCRPVKSLLEGVEAGEPIGSVPLSTVSIRGPSLMTARLERKLPTSLRN